MLLAKQDPSVLEDIENHSFTSVDREVGGVLVGDLTDDGAVITAALPALRAVGEQTNVTFTHDVWEDVLATIDREHAGKKIVGWYHTHPGFGLFLSAYDKFIHQNFFSDRRMTALVVDPVAGEVGCFAWKGDELVLTDSRPTARAPITNSSASTTAVSSRRPQLLIAGAAAVLAGAIGGYIFGSHSQDAQVSDQAGRIGAVQQDAAAAHARVNVLHGRLQDRASKTERNPVSAPGQSDGSTQVTYRVRPGDSLWALAYSFYGHGDRYQTIQRTNHNVSARHLLIGRPLQIPIVTPDN
jgi:proteasome lid subunit RPN8/RPN11